MNTCKYKNANNCISYSFPCIKYVVIFLHSIFVNCYKTRRTVFLIKPDATVMAVSLCNITEFTKHFSFITDYLSLYSVGIHFTETKKWRYVILSLLWGFQEEEFKVLIKLMLIYIFMFVYSPVVQKYLLEKSLMLTRTQWTTLSRSLLLAGRSICIREAVTSSSEDWELQLF
jgi:hypothetical protein